jgi:hypothetical protein
MFLVMAELVPAIHAHCFPKVVDARHKHATTLAKGRTRLAGHDDDVRGIKSDPS